MGFAVDLRISFRLRSRIADPLSIDCRILARHAFSCFLGSARDCHVVTGPTSNKISANIDTAMIRGRAPRVESMGRFGSFYARCSSASKANPFALFVRRRASFQATVMIIVLGTNIPYFRAD